MNSRERKEKLICRKGIYHRFNIFAQDASHTGEVCILCGMSVQFNKKDNATYYEFHKADFAQPGSRVFRKVYGKKGIQQVQSDMKLAPKTKAEQAKDWDDAGREAKDYMKSLDDDGNIRKLR